MESHLTEAEIVRLIDGSKGDDDERLYQHLLQCELCLADYKFMARSRISSHHSPLPDRELQSLIAAGEAIAQRASYPSPARHGEGRGHRLRPSVRGLAAVAAALLISVSALWTGRTELRPPSVGTDVADPIRIAMTAFSNRAVAVLPGTEDRISATQEIYRSGRALVDDEAVLAALSSLSKRYQDGDESRDLLFWLIGGYFATQQYRPAFDVANRASRLYPDDDEIATMAGVAAYYNDDLDAAKRQLRRVTEKEPDYAVAAVNLGLVLIEKGEPDAAHTLLSSVIDAHRGTPLAARAESLLPRGE